MSLRVQDCLALICSICSLDCSVCMSGHLSAVHLSSCTRYTSFVLLLECVGRLAASSSADEVLSTSTFESNPHRGHALPKSTKVSSSSSSQRANQCRLPDNSSHFRRLSLFWASSRAAAVALPRSSTSCKNLSRSKTFPLCYFSRRVPSLRRPFDHTCTCLAPIV